MSRFDALLARRERIRLKEEEKRKARAANGQCGRCGEYLIVAELLAAPDRRWCVACVAWCRAYQKDINATRRVLKGDTMTRRVES